MKLDILAFGAHPDDVELGCSGTLARSISQGMTVGIVDLSYGELGTKGDVQTRQKEATKAATILGIKLRKNLGLPDGFIANDRESRLKIVQILRTYRPEIIFLTAKNDRHIDHRNSNRLINDACFLSGLKKIETKDKNGKCLEAWRPKVILEYIQWEELKPDIIYDITGFLELKMSAIRAYRSQFFNSEENPDITPISKPGFLEAMQSRALNLGRLIGTKAGEGFTSPNPLSIDRLSVLIR